MKDQFWAEVAEDRLAELAVYGEGRGFHTTRRRWEGAWRLRGPAGDRHLVRPITIQFAWMSESWDDGGRWLEPSWDGAPSYTVWESMGGQIARCAADLF